MILALLKVLAPAAAAATLLAHTAGAMAGGVLGLADVAGATGDCTAPQRGAVCATLFSGTSPLFPGGPAQVRQVRITYSGDRPASALGLYTEHFTPRAAQSGPYCAAGDPAAMIDVSIREQGRTLFQGSLEDMATSHPAPPDMLPLPGPWAGGDAHVYTISVSLDPAAGNAYMGCASAADFVWLAAQ